MNRYRVMLPLLIDGEWGQGDEFEKELSEDEELANLQSGLLEIVPAEYKVVGDSVVWDTKPGSTFEKALTLGEERLLVEGGHIEKVEKSKPKSKPKADKE